MGSQRPRQKGGQSGDAVAGAKKGKPRTSVPPMFRGFVKHHQREGVVLERDATARVRAAWEEGGEARGLLQEQIEWVRQWIFTGELEPKDAVTALRGLSKVLEQVEGRVSNEPVSVTIETVAAPVEDTGDRLAIH